LEGVGRWDIVYLSGCGPFDASKCSKCYAPNATLRLVRSTNIMNAAIATQVNQLVAFITMYEFLLQES